MKNVTVTLDERTVAWARVYAARRNMSLSRFLGELLHASMRESCDYDRGNASQGLKQSVAMDRLRVLWLEERGRISTQVLSEIYITLTRSREIESRYQLS